MTPGLCGAQSQLSAGTAEPTGGAVEGGARSCCSRRLPRLSVGRTPAACAGKGVWGRESLVYVGTLCQPARDPGRLDLRVQGWKASIEASVIARDF